MEFFGLKRMRKASNLTEEEVVFNKSSNNAKSSVYEETSRNYAEYFFLDVRSFHRSLRIE